MRLKIKIAILKCLLAADGLPMPEGAVRSAVEILLRPAEVTESDFDVAIKEAASEKYCEGVTDDFTRERSWTLTTHGEHKARKLK